MDKMVSFKPTENLKDPGAFARPTKSGCFMVKDASAPFEKYEITRRALGPSDVAIQIKFVGICHSDIHQARNHWSPGTFPMVPGHEIVGVVVTTGLVESSFQPGDAVGVGCMVDSCRNCRNCRSGEEQYCEDNGTVFTYNSKFKHPHCVERGNVTYGGYSESIIVDEKFVLKIPQGMNLPSAAPLLCAGITTYGAFMKNGLLGNQRLAIIGIGGLGHVAVKIGKALGCHVTAISHNSSKRRSALDHLGAHNFIDLNNEGSIASANGSFDFILDTMPTEHDLSNYMNLLRVGGKYVVVGLPPGKLKVSASSLVGNRKVLTGSKIGGIEQTQEMLNFCNRHGITCDIELVEASDINECYERVIKSDVMYRFVVDATSFSSSVANVHGSK